MAVMMGPDYRLVCGIDRNLPDWFAKQAQPTIQARHLYVSLGERDRIHVAIELLKTVATN